MYNDAITCFARHDPDGSYVLVQADSYMSGAFQEHGYDFCSDSDATELGQKLQTLAPCAP